MLEVVYTWPDGREEVRYRRVLGSIEARELEREVEFMRENDPQSPYSCRYPRATYAAV